MSSFKFRKPIKLNCTFSSYRAAIAFIWSHIYVHLMNINLLYTNFSSHSWSKLLNEISDTLLLCYILVFIF